MTDDPMTDEPVLELPCGRTALVAVITTFLAGQDAASREGIRGALEQELDKAGPGALVGLVERLATAGADWGYYPRDPLARRIHHLFADRILRQSPVLVGVEHFDTVAGAPVVIAANHLSYADANLLEVLFSRAGGTAPADRLTVVAGPKVYSNLKRRFSSLCFGSIKTPQSSALSTEDAVMSAREVARAARLSIDIAHERLGLGDALVVFPEGTRSRTACLQPMLPGVTRYLDGPEAWVVPVGITGTDGLFPVGDDTLHAVPMVTRIGRPLSTSALRARSGDDRRLMMDTVGLAIASLLAPEHRGVYADDIAGLDDARALLAELAG